MSTVLLVLGLVLAAVGGDRFVRGSVGLAAWLRIPAGIIGATVAAFATSSPELTVGVLSAADGHSELAFGDATGSNMVNLAVVLGLALLIGAISVSWVDVRREILTFVSALAIVMAAAIDGHIERFESIGMLALFTVWLSGVVRDARRRRSDVGILADVDHRAIVADVLIGLVLLIVAGRLIVLGGKEIGEILGWSEFVVGTVIVAIGTSAPELVTTIIAARRGHIGVGVGTVLGSNIFNSLFIIGIAGTIDQIDVDMPATSIAIGASVIATALIVPGRRQRLGRVRGSALVLVYGGFLATLVFALGT